ncbi:unnamed protein product [Mytilus coruscus]|uniref:ASIC5 n=1 Tax=Mytilus coruscus TaxID=42192 RepID=A0A6J8DTP0_MYTCO|nr:unnamed protein product [Mytilus coruscus]
MTEEKIAVSENDVKTKRFKALKDFSDQTSFHGLRYVAEETTFPHRRILWLILILVCFGASVYQISDRVIYYNRWPVTVNLGVNYNKTLQFPAVTICNQNAFKATLAEKYGWYKMIEKMFTTQSGVDELLQDSFYGNITLESLYLNTTHQKEDLIFSCLWKGKTCKSDDFKTVLTDHGVCFTWNSNDDHVSSPGIISFDVSSPGIISFDDSSPGIISFDFE